LGACNVPTELPRVLSRAQVRDVDRRAIEDYGLPGVVLMENAGRNAAALFLSLVPAGTVAICCGKGNNAGDGFVVARYLANAGYDVTALLTSDPSDLAGDAAIHFHVWQASGGRILSAADLERVWPDELARAQWIIDALLGTGTRGSVRDPFLTAIRLINSAGRPVFALDLPSGLDCDTGEILGDCVQARHTATFVAAKPGFSTAGAQHCLGVVHVLDIGVPNRLLQEIAQNAD